VIGQLAFGVVFLAGLFLASLGVLSLAAPALARRFLLGFAASPLLHYSELAIRCVLGAAFLLHAPTMRFPLLFIGAGWVLLLTTAGLLLVPWRWHRRFAERSVPAALRFLPLLGVASLLLAGLVFLGLFGSAG
jgi:hypothetical protein